MSNIVKSIHRDSFKEFLINHVDDFKIYKDRYDIKIDINEYDIFYNRYAVILVNILISFDDDNYGVILDSYLIELEIVNEFNIINYHRVNSYYGNEYFRLKCMEYNQPMITFTIMKNITNYISNRIQIFKRTISHIKKK